jgi:hypothetical protein
MVVIEPYDVVINSKKVQLAGEPLYKKCYWIQFYVSDWGTLSSTDIIYFGTVDRQILPMRLDDQVDFGSSASVKPRVNGTDYYARASNDGNAKIVVIGEFFDESEYVGLNDGQQCTGVCPLERMLKDEFRSLFSGI